MLYITYRTKYLFDFFQRLLSCLPKNSRKYEVIENVERNVAILVIEVDILDTRYSGPGMNLLVL